MLLSSVTRQRLSMAILVIATAFVLGCNSDPRPTQTKEQFELKQTNQGQIVRLNKETGEIDIIEAGNSLPARTAGKSRSSTPRPTVTTAPHVGLRSTNSPEPEAKAKATVRIAAPALGQLLTLTSGAPIFVSAHRAPTPLLVVSQGSEFRLLGVEGEWYRVEFNDPRWGKRVGFVEKDHAIVRTEAVELEPVDLSVHDSPQQKVEEWPVNVQAPAPQSAVDLSIVEPQLSGNKTREQVPGPQSSKMKVYTQGSTPKRDANRFVTVTIVGVQGASSTFSGVVPGFSTGQAKGTATCIASGPIVNCAGGATASGFTIPPRAYEFAVEGATYALRLPDNRIVTVTCAYKETLSSVRSCRRPMSMTLYAKFDGNKAKLIWPIGVDGKKTESETYNVVRIDAPAPATK